MRSVISVTVPRELGCFPDPELGRRTARSRRCKPCYRASFRARPALALIGFCNPCAPGLLAAGRHQDFVAKGWQALGEEDLLQPARAEERSRPRASDAESRSAVERPTDLAPPDAYARPAADCSTLAPSGGIGVAVRLVSRRSREAPLRRHATTGRRERRGRPDARQSRAAACGGQVANLVSLPRSAFHPPLLARARRREPGPTMPRLP
jgi:hypothetical protein